MDNTTPQTTWKTQLTITEAASLAGVNRTYFYEKFINPGLITVHKDHRDKKFIELVELLAVTWPLQKKFPNSPNNTPTTNPTTSQTTSPMSATTHSDNTPNNEATQILQVKLEALRGMLHAKEEILRVKNEQLEQAQAREQFYQEELRAVRLLAAPQLSVQKEANPKQKKRFFGIF